MACRERIQRTQKIFSVCAVEFAFNITRDYCLPPSGFPLLHTHLAVPTTAIRLTLFLAQGLAPGHEKALTAMVAELTAFV
jgi:hypothetical protein